MAAASLRGSQIPLPSFPFSHYKTSHSLRKPQSLGDARSFAAVKKSKSRVLKSAGRASGDNGAMIPSSSSEEGTSSAAVEEEKEQRRPAFDINLAVLLAGFAFEAYTSPPKDVGWREMDAAECQTIFLSQTQRSKQMCQLKRILRKCTSTQELSSCSGSTFFRSGTESSACDTGLPSMCRFVGSARSCVPAVRHAYCSYKGDELTEEVLETGDDLGDDQQT